MVEVIASWKSTHYITTMSHVIWNWNTSLWESPASCNLKWVDLQKVPGGDTRKPCVIWWRILLNMDNLRDMLQCNQPAVNQSVKEWQRGCSKVSQKTRTQWQLDAPCDSDWVLLLPKLLVQFIKFDHISPSGRTKSQASVLILMFVGLFYYHIGECPMWIPMRIRHKWIQKWWSVICYLFSHGS